MNKWQKSLRGMVAVIVALGLLIGPAAAPAAETVVRAHPLLALLAAEAPEQLVAVIVQETADTDAPERLVASLGGAVTKDLHIINAFAAELPASAAVRLAAHPSVRWVSLDGAVESAGRPPGKGGDGDSTPPLPSSYFLDTLRVRQVWNLGYRGEGVTVAVIDSGIKESTEFLQGGKGKGSQMSRILFKGELASGEQANADLVGHGTHVAGIIAGNGDASGGVYSGIAPKANLVVLKISDNDGMALESDVVASMQWVLDNKAAYNIRVVNLSINSTVEQSYHASPLDAAAEILWFNGIVVVASAGNKGGADGKNTVNAAPANDPFIITVGAFDEMGTASRADDSLASFSASGRTLDDFIKPEVYAPGANIISALAHNEYPSSWEQKYPDHIVATDYFRASGTSMAAPMVAGAAALLLQAQPHLTPDQVKYRLLNTATYPAGTGRPYMDVYAAVTGTSTASANTGLTASQLLWTGTEPVTWDSVTWNSVMWNSVMWNSVMWNSVMWNSVAFGQ